MNWCVLGRARALKPHDGELALCSCHHMAMTGLFARAFGPVTEMAVRCGLSCSDSRLLLEGDAAEN